MANNPFDQRIINQLERPTSSDLNIAQGQINANVRAFARQLLQSTQSAWNTGVGPSGALGNSFIIRAAASPTTGSVTMTRGVGFAAYADVNESTNIGGIAGLSTNLDYPVIYSQDQVLNISAATNPSVGHCRRDVIAIRAIGQSEEGLTDNEPTDIYNPLLSAFSSETVSKTLTADLTGQTVTVLNSGDLFTGAIVYIKGLEAPYTGPESFETAPLPPSPATPYINIAVINRHAAQGAITEADIVDFRLLVAPGGQLTITGSATVGATSGTTPGAALSNVVIKAPPGIKASIYKLGANSLAETNTYALIVAGPRGISSANMTCTLGLPGGDVTDTLFPSQVVLGAQSRNLAADVATVALLADSAKSSPVQTVAVGQPYHVFPFTVGTVENYVQSVTVPFVVTAGGSITIGDPPNYPAMYPAGTYDVSGNTNTRSYYLNWAVSPASPVVGLQNPTYALEAAPTSTPSSFNTILSSYPAQQRVGGFVVSPTDGSVSNTIPSGLWKLSMTARVAAYNASLIAKVYLYNGSADPESGELIADSPVVEIASAGSGSWRQTLFIRFPSSVSIGANRIYVALYALGSNAVAEVAFLFGDEYPAILETNILSAAPTVTIPDSTTNYPAATYPVTGTTGTVTLDIPTGQPFFNPEATRFGTSGVSNLRTIPVNFTVTLNR